jgi:hypothetical protein
LKALYEFHGNDWKGTSAEASLQDHVLEAVVAYRLENALWKLNMASGALASLDAKAAQPVVSLDLERRFAPTDSGFRVFGVAASRADWDSRVTDGKYEAVLRDGASAKLGAGFADKAWNLEVFGISRYYANPATPEPLAFAHYAEQVRPRFAWVSGGGFHIGFRTLHHIALEMNASSVYGEYALAGGRSLPWVANSRLDMVSHLRYYPRSDSLLSVIVSHQAAWRRPLYAFSIDEARGTRTVRATGEFTNLFRTDLRLNLDLTSQVKVLFLERVRFYVEANNIFSALQGTFFEFLGGENGRQRSVAVQGYRETAGGAAYDLDPFLAKGMGLYVQFGIEGSLGF